VPVPGAFLVKNGSKIRLFTSGVAASSSRDPIVTSESAGDDASASSVRCSTSQSAICDTRRALHGAITSPGRTKMIAESVPAAEATVRTMLFSRIDESFTGARTAIETTAAGMDAAKVRPSLRPT
jgi:hypothetical protein